MDQASSSTSETSTVNQIDQCLGLLKGPQDEQKFVGLLLATKVLQPDDKENIAKVFHAVGTKFLNRLLNTTTEDGLYKTLALNVLSTFCRNMPEIIDDPFFLEKLPVFLDIIRSSNDEVLVGDSWACVESVLTSTNGVRKVLSDNYVNFLGDFVTNPGSDEKLSKMLSIIQHMASILPTLKNNIYAEVYPLTLKLSEAFKVRKDLVKFEILDLLISLISTFNTSVKFKEVPDWAEDVRLGVQEIMSSKVTSKHRDPAIMLSGLVFDFVGKSWPLGKDSKFTFVELLLQFIKIECRLTLEEDEIPASKFPMLTICFHTLENYVQYLSLEGKDEWSSVIPTEIITRFGEAFRDIFKDVLFLIRNHSNLEVGSPFYQLQESAVRVIGHWLVQESEALRKEVEEALPSIMLYLSNNESLLETWISAFPSLTTEDSLRQVFEQNSGVQLLVSYISKNGKKQLSKCVAELKASEQNLGDASAIITNSLDILLNLLFLAPDARQQAQLADELLPIVPFLTSGMQDFGQLGLSHAHYLSIYAHFVALALNILSLLPQDQLKDTTEIFAGAVAFFERYSYFNNEAVWEAVGDLWTLAVTGIVKCSPKHNKLKETFHSSKLGQQLKQGVPSNTKKHLQATLSQLRGL